MTITQKKILIAGILFLGSAVPVGYLVVEVSPWFIPLPFMLLVGLNVYVFKFRCKKCQTPSIRRLFSIAGTQIEYYSPLFGRCCSKCGQAME